LGRRRNDRCYRVRGGLEFLGDDEEPLCHSMRTEAQVYRFTWRSGFDGGAAVRIGRQGDQITLHWIYRWYGRINSLFGRSGKFLVSPCHLA
jgi:hypothetical protein